MKVWLKSFLFLLLKAALLCSQWSQDPTVNTVLDKPGDQRAPLITTDGKGGAIVAWNENLGVFANWVDRFGFRRWGHDGIRVSPEGRIAGVTNILSDGHGSAVIVWEDLTHARQVGDEVVDIIENEIFVQRVDSLGQLVWDEAGIGIRTKIDSTTAFNFEMVTSDYQEFIVVWTEDRRHPYPQSLPLDFFAQKIDLDGNLLWQENGRLITVHGSLVNVRRRVVTDGAGGFLLTRFGEGNGNTVVERVSAEGELLWQPGGVPVHTGGAFEIDTDRSGGAVVAGVFFPGAGVAQVRGQRVSPQGKLVWNENGIVLSETADVRTFIEIANDGKSGAIVEWSEEREGRRQSFLQRVNGEGMQVWQTEGTPLNKAGFLMNDKEGGVILVRSEIIQDSVKTYRKSLQKFDSLGIRKWETEGVTYQIRRSDPGGYRSFISDGSGGIIVVWEEFSFQTSWDIVLQQVSRNGKLGDVITAVERSPAPIGPREYALFQNYPNPFNPNTQIRFRLREAGVVSLKIFNLSGKEVITLLNQKMLVGEHRVHWNGTEGSNRFVASGIYFYRLRVNEFQAVRKMIYIR